MYKYYIRLLCTEFVIIIFLNSLNAQKPLWINYNTSNSGLPDSSVS